MSENAFLQWHMKVEGTFARERHKKVPGTNVLVTVRLEWALIQPSREPDSHIGLDLVIVHENSCNVVNCEIISAASNEELMDMARPGLPAVWAGKFGAEQLLARTVISILAAYCISEV
jgi:hypothetical protein